MPRRGEPLSAVTVDRVGTARPQGNGFDVGAYEWVPPSTGGDEPGGTTGGDIVVHAVHADTIMGDWRLTADPTAAAGWRLWHPDAGRSNGTRAAPAHYFEMNVWVQSGTPYRLWVRGMAERNDRRNDEVDVQFTGSLSTNGNAAYRIGTKGSVTIVLQECSGCPLSGWGWQDTATGLGVLGPLVMFDGTGFQTVRVQTREDGMSIDQVVLSPVAYLSDAPGAPRNDSTILPEP